MSTPLSSPVPMWRRPLGLVVIVALAFGLTLAAMHWGGWLRWGSQSGARSPGGALVPAPGEVPQLQLAIESDGRVLLSAPGRLAVPQGTRFAVRMQADRAGQFELHAINAAGQSSAQPLWQAAVAANQPVLSDKLRTDGPGGVQTLRVLFKPQGAGLPREAQFTIWHP